MIKDGLSILIPEHYRYIVVYSSNDNNGRCISSNNNDGLHEWYKWSTSVFFFVDHSWDHDWPCAYLVIGEYTTPMACNEFHSSNQAGLLADHENSRAKPSTVMVDCANKYLWLSGGLIRSTNNEYKLNVNHHSRWWTISIIIYHRGVKHL